MSAQKTDLPMALLCKPRSRFARLQKGITPDGLESGIQRYRFWRLSDPPQVPSRAMATCKTPGAVVY